MSYPLGQSKRDDEKQKSRKRKTKHQTFRKGKRGMKFRGFTNPRSLEQMGRGMLARLVTRFESEFAGLGLAMAGPLSILANFG